MSARLRHCGRGGLIDIIRAKKPGFSEKLLSKQRDLQRNKGDGLVKVSGKTRPYKTINHNSRDVTCNVSTTELDLI
ncbi:MAG TPA: hypothetical protein DCZ55_12445 [Cyanobacteria bacterium UBA11371]|nr:hypothetical protein [Cyanobacteria bacterium UBA11371]HBE33039.1 hypothetical protein [Cyanobacteria bacterium UBA11368]